METQEHVVAESEALRAHVAAVEKLGEALIKRSQAQAALKAAEAEVDLATKDLDQADDDWRTMQTAGPSTAELRHAKADHVQALLHERERVEAYVTDLFRDMENAHNQKHRAEHALQLWEAHPQLWPGGTGEERKQQVQFAANWVASAVKRLADFRAMQKRGWALRDEVLRKVRQSRQAAQVQAKLDAFLATENLPEVEEEPDRQEAQTSAASLKE